MEVGHRDAAQHRAHDPQEPLVVPADEQVLQVRASRLDFAGHAVHRSVQVAGHCLMVRGVKKSVNTMRSRKSGTNCSTSLWILGSHSALAATYSASRSPLQPSKLARQVIRIMLLGRGLS